MRFVYSLTFIPFLQIFRPEELGVHIASCVFCPVVFEEGNVDRRFNSALSFLGLEWQHGVCPPGYPQMSHSITAKSIQNTLFLSKRWNLFFLDSPNADSNSQKRQLAPNTYK